MPTKYLLLTLMLILSSVTFARGPAVEDFVGIDVEESQGNVHGAEFFYNLEQDVNQIAQVNADTESNMTAQSSQWSSMVFTLFALFGFPMMIWVLAMNHLKKKAREDSAANIEVLENYRRNKSNTQTSDEETRKVS